MTHLEPSTYFKVTGLIFVVIVVLHVYRIFMDVTVNFGDWTVPIWVSWVALVVAAYLAWSAYQNQL
mgnify:CR=1 FL=1